MTAGDQCVFNGDCSDGLVCAGRFCREQCSAADAGGRDCPSGFRCDRNEEGTQNVCVPNAAPTLCSYASDCPEGQLCGPRGECAAPCASDTDCRRFLAQNATCNRMTGACEIAPRPTTRVGPAGGVVQGDGVRLVFAAGAVAEPIDVTITQAPPVEPMQRSPTFTFTASPAGASGPTDIVFAAPVALTIDAQGAIADTSIVYFTDRTDAFQPLGGHRDATGVTALIEHFSRAYLGPIAPGFFRRPVQLALAGTYSCARMADGSAWCWGDLDGSPDSMDDQTTPSVRPGFAGETHIAVTGRAVLGLGVGGRLRVYAPALGITRFVVSDFAPGALGLAGGYAPIETVVSGSSAQSLACAPDGEMNGVTCVGTNDFFQRTPTATSGGPDDALFRPGFTPLRGAVSQVSTSGAHVCARLADGSVWCWGANASGERSNTLANNSASSVPRWEPLAMEYASGQPVADATDVATAPARSCVIGAGGSLSCAGRYFPAGLASTLVSTGVTKVAVGAEHVCYVAQEATEVVRCFGSSIFGQAGDAAISAPINPPGNTIALALTASERITQIAAGGDHTCVLTSTARVLCWGRNDYGQTGTTPSGVPVTTPTDAFITLR